MDNSISLALNHWKTFVFPIDQAYWTMVSGNWADLMDHVNSFEMMVEFINGTEIVWMDNFCISNIPPVAEFSANKLIEFAGNPVQFTDLSDQMVPQAGTGISAMAKAAATSTRFILI